jgi:hypothetical protein
MTQVCASLPKAPLSNDINACIKPCIEYKSSQQQLMFLLWRELDCTRQLEWMMGITTW